MKTFTPFLVLALAGTVMLYSCRQNKQAADDSDKSNIENKTNPVTAFRIALSNLNIADQKAIFRGLSPDVRSALWQDRIQGALATSLSSEQKEVLQQVSTHLTPAVYNLDSSMQREAFGKFYQEWITKAKGAFKNDSASLISITTQLGGKNQTTAIAQGAPVVPSCDCNLAARQTSCDDCLLTNCKAVTCTASTLGCGCWWLSACDGVCK
jgi:hypothetical protein